MENDIELRRVERGLTQSELAAAVDVTRQTIGAIEAGRYDPRLELAFDLAAFFDCAVDDLFWRADDTADADSDRSS